jgi:hypothetical protein
MCFAVESASAELATADQGQISESEVRGRYFFGLKGPLVPPVL